MSGVLIFKYKSKSHNLFFRLLALNASILRIDISFKSFKSFISLFDSSRAETGEGTTEDRIGSTTGTDSDSHAVVTAVGGGTGLVPDVGPGIGPDGIGTIADSGSGG